MVRAVARRRQIGACKAARLRPSRPVAIKSVSNPGGLGTSDKMGSISTRMTERFGCRHPFASAGLAFAGGTADLALAGCGKSRSVVLPAQFVAFCPFVIG